MPDSTSPSAKSVEDPEARGSPLPQQRPPGDVADEPRGTRGIELAQALTGVEGR
jgi:hypothetical protein